MGYGRMFDPGSTPSTGRLVNKSDFHRQWGWLGGDPVAILREPMLTSDGLTRDLLIISVGCVVGAPRFELGTPSPPDWCKTYS
jgi:hypothetical protein